MAMRVVEGELESTTKMRADFRLFLWYLWVTFLTLPTPTDIQYDVAAYLQHGPRRRFIQAFRGVGKSWITAAYVVWRLWNNPQLKVLIVSANEDKAKEIANFIYGLIHTVPELRELKPRDSQRTAVTGFDVGPSLPDPAPSVRVDGIFGQITGARADIILSDDVEVPKNSETEQMRTKLEERTKEYAAIIKPGGEIIYLGTPQSDESIYRKLPEKGYGVRIWPARYPIQANIEHYNGNLAPMLVDNMKRDPALMMPTSSDCGGSPTDPQRFNDMDLMEREAEYRRAGFMLQFQLDVRQSDTDKHPLKLRDLIVMDVSEDVAPVQIVWAGGKDTRLEGLPNLGYDGDRFHKPMYVAKDWLNYQGSVMVVDPSGRGKDETAFVVLKMLNGMLYLKRAGGVVGGYETETLETLAYIAKAHKVNMVRVEGNFGDGMFLKLLEPIMSRIYPVTLEEYKVTGQKERRILDKLEPVIQGHRLVVDRELIEMDAAGEQDAAYKLMYQLTHITKARGSLRHDDRLDALAEAVGYFTTMLNSDVAVAEKARMDKLWAAEYKKHIRDQVTNLGEPEAGVSRKGRKSFRRSLH